MYRDEGKVTFDPAQSKPPPVPPDGKHVARVTFETPGTYVLRARAHGGALLGDEELTITVTR